MLAPVVRTTTVLSSALDLQGFESALIAFHIGVFGDAASATVFFEAELQECDTTGGSYTAVADSDLLFPGAGVARTGTVAASGVFFQSKTTAAADTAGLYTIGYRGSKRIPQGECARNRDELDGNACVDRGLRWPRCLQPGSVIYAGSHATNGAHRHRRAFRAVVSGRGHHQCPRTPRRCSYSGRDCHGPTDSRTRSRIAAGSPAQSAVQLPKKR
jgi:hypothetical protein